MTDTNSNPPFQPALEGPRPDVSATDSTLEPAVDADIASNVTAHPSGTDTAITPPHMKPKRDIGESGLRRSLKILRTLAELGIGPGDARGGKAGLPPLGELDYLDPQAARARLGEALTLVTLLAKRGMNRQPGRRLLQPGPFMPPAEIEQALQRAIQERRQVQVTTVAGDVRLVEPYEICLKRVDCLRIPYLFWRGAVTKQFMWFRLSNMTSVQLLQSHFVWFDYQSVKKYKAGFFGRP